MSYISIQGLHKSYHNEANGKKEFIRVFVDFNLEVGQGEFLTVFGPNGCGKSTLLSLLAGLISADAGIVRIGGKPPQESNFGFIFQNYGDSLFPWRTLLDNVSFPLEVRGVSKRAARDKAKTFISDMGLSNLFDLEGAYPYQLSGGLQQLTAIARALVYAPDVLLMDEPFGSLDFQTRLFLQDGLMRLWERTKVTIIFVSHEVNEALYLGNRMILLSRQPARVRDVIENRLPTPRNHAILTTPEFSELRNRALSSFTQELML